MFVDDDVSGVVGEQCRAASVSLEHLQWSHRVCGNKSVWLAVRR